jgi:hypothetical protein
MMPGKRGDSLLPVTLNTTALYTSPRIQTEIEGKHPEHFSVLVRGQRPIVCLAFYIVYKADAGPVAFDVHIPRICSMACLLLSLAVDLPASHPSCPLAISLIHQSNSSLPASPLPMVFLFGQLYPTYLSLDILEDRLQESCLAAPLGLISEWRISR